jgi:2-C-methyl-D-erythritol 4-phosphate cytidylyltransferase
MKTYAIIAASGIGKRMKLQNGLSKQMLEIGGQPVIYHTIRAFEKASTVAGIFIATKAESIPALEEMAAEHGFGKIRGIIEGGRERQDSVRNCIALIEKESHETGSLPDAILVHDGARPLIQPEEIDEIAAMSAAFGACVPATRPKDTIKFIGKTPDVFGETLDRSRLLQVQTPQGFAGRLLVQAHLQAELEQWYATDDAALVERFFPEQEIRVYEMGYHNIKITTPEDVYLAEAIHARLVNRQADGN